MTELEKIRAYSPEELKHAIFEQCVYLNRLFENRRKIETENYPDTEDGRLAQYIDSDSNSERCLENERLLDYMFDRLMEFGWK